MLPLKSALDEYWKGLAFVYQLDTNLFRYLKSVCHTVSLCCWALCLSLPLVSSWSTAWTLLLLVLSHILTSSTGSPQRHKGRAKLAHSSSSLDAFTTHSHKNDCPQYSFLIMRIALFYKSKQTLKYLLYSASAKLYTVRKIRISY